MLSFFAAVRRVFVIHRTSYIAIIGIAFRLIATKRLAIDLIVIGLARLFGDLLRCQMRRFIFI